MKQIGLAFRTWSLDNENKLPMQVPVGSGGTMEMVDSGAVWPHFQVMSNELSTPKVLACPNDANRTMASNFVHVADRNLSYFVNVDARNRDATSILSGDANITNRPPHSSRFVTLTARETLAWTRAVHGEKGNILFGDAQVTQVKNSESRSVLNLQSGITNRLAVP